MEGLRRLCMCCGNPFTLYQGDSNYTDWLCCACLSEHWGERDYFADMVDAMRREAFRLDGSSVAREAYQAWCDRTVEDVVDMSEFDSQ